MKLPSMPEDAMISLFQSHDFQESSSIVEVGPSLYQILLSPASFLEAAFVLCTPVLGALKNKLGLCPSLTW